MTGSEITLGRRGLALVLSGQVLLSRTPQPG